MAPTPEIAQLAGVSTQTLDRDIKGHALEGRTGPRGQKLFRVADFVRIGRLKATDVPTGPTAAQAVEVLRRLQAQVTELLRENGELRGRLAEVRSARDQLLGQLSTKDAQVKAADVNVQRLLGLLTRSAA